MRDREYIPGNDSEGHKHRPRSMSAVVAQYRKQCEQYAALSRQQKDPREQRIMLYAEIKALGWVMGKGDNDVARELDAVCKGQRLW